MGSSQVESPASVEPAQGGPDVAAAAAAAPADPDSQLLDAVVAIGAGLELPATLRRIVRVAREMAGAEYAALGVIAPDRSLSEFVYDGIDDATAARIGELPHGRGVLGLLIDRPHPIRMSHIGEHPSSYGFPAHHPPMHSFLGVPIRVRGSVFGNLYLTEKRGAPEFTEHDERIVLALAAAAGVAIENARLYEGVRRRERRLDATAEITTAVLSGSPAAEVLQLVVTQVRELVAADTAALFLRSPDQRLRLELVDGSAPQLPVGVIVPQNGMVSLVAETGRSLVVDDLTGDDRVILPQLQALGPAMIVPLGAAGRSLGALVVANRPARPRFRPEELSTAESFASQAAFALVLAESQRDQQRLAVLEDRDRIARDLHDLVIQRIFATGMMLQGVARMVEAVPEAPGRLTRAVDELDATIREVRSTIFDLHTPEPSGSEHEAGVRAMVLRETAAAGEVLGFSPSVTFDGPVDALVPLDVGEHLLAAVREALSNVARHAHARHASVEITARNDQLVLVVTDDGVGIGPTTRRSGLGNLGERAAQLGGACDVRPRADGTSGTVLVWRVPLRRG